VFEYGSHLVMNSELKQLLVLQERDSKLLQAKRDLEKIPLDAVKIKEGLNQKLEAVKIAKANFLNAEKDVKQVDLDRQVRKDTINKLKTRQAETKKNEEYQMLAHEIIRYGKEIDELETKELELMEQVDVRVAEREAAQVIFEKEKEYATELSQDLVARKHHSEVRIKELESDRNLLVEKVPNDARELYERLLSNKGGDVVVLITPSGQCTGCNMKLPSSTLHKVLADEELVQCSECSRILYNA